MAWSDYDDDVSMAVMYGVPGDPETWRKPAMSGLPWWYVPGVGIPGIPLLGLGDTTGPCLGDSEWIFPEHTFEVSFSYSDRRGVIRHFRQRHRGFHDSPVQVRYLASEFVSRFLPRASRLRSGVCVARVSTERSMPTLFRGFIRPDALRAYTASRAVPGFGPMPAPGSGRATITPADLEALRRGDGGTYVPPGGGAPPPAADLGPFGPGADAGATSADTADGSTPAETTGEEAPVDSGVYEEPSFLDQHGKKILIGAAVVISLYAAYRIGKKKNRGRSRRSNTSVASRMAGLKQQATRATWSRGHDMKAFKHYTPDNAVASCRKCGMEVQVLAKPAPNEIDVGGEAVALNCPGYGKRSR